MLHLHFIHEGKVCKLLLMPKGIIHAVIVLVIMQIEHFHGTRIKTMGVTFETKKIFAKSLALRLQTVIPSLIGLD